MWFGGRYIASWWSNKWTFKWSWQPPYCILLYIHVSFRSFIIWFFLTSKKKNSQRSSKGGMGTTAQDRPGQFIDSHALVHLRKWLPFTAHVVPLLVQTALLLTLLLEACHWHFEVVHCSLQSCLSTVLFSYSRMCLFAAKLFWIATGLYITKLNWMLPNVTVRQTISFCEFQAWEWE